MGQSSKRGTCGAFTALAVALGCTPGLARPADDNLDRTVSRAIDAGGPFLTDSEQAVIRRKCGYAAGEWDGSSLDMRGDILICSNGRLVDDREVRPLTARVGARVRARVRAVMQRSDVRAAIDAEIARRLAVDR